MMRLLSLLLGFVAATARVEPPTPIFWQWRGESAPASLSIDFICADVGFATEEVTVLRFAARFILPSAFGDEMVLSSDK